MPIWQDNRIESSPRIYDLLSHTFLDSLIVLHGPFKSVGSISRSGQWSNQTVVAFFWNIHDTITPVSLFARPVGVFRVHFSFPTACIASSSTMKARQERWSCRWRRALCFEIEVYRVLSSRILPASSGGYPGIMATACKVWGPCDSFTNNSKGDHPFLALGFYLLKWGTSWRYCPLL